MNSLASILYSSSSANKKKRKNLSFQPTLKPMSATKQSRCQVGMLLRSSTPKTLPTRIKTTINAHPTTLTTPSSSSSISLSMNSPQSPRCSTPLFAKQRRTRPFIVCDLCRQRAFQSLNSNENKAQTDTQIKTEHEKQSATPHFHHSASLHYYQYPMTNTSNSIRRRRRDRQRSSIDQLLVWIV